MRKSEMRSLDAAQRNPGWMRRQGPGFRCAPSRLHAMWPASLLRNLSIAEYRAKKEKHAEERDA
jgi:hypothetical protein